MKERLTVAVARDMDFGDLIEAADDLTEQFAPGEHETEQQTLKRLSDTLDNAPEVYRWLLTLESWFDHWTDAYADQFGMKDNRYKSMRERRDAMKRAASAAKMRYDGASRRITVLQGFEDRMPRGRS